MIQIYNKIDMIYFTYNKYITIIIFLTLLNLFDFTQIGLNLACSLPANPDKVKNLQTFESFIEDILLC